MSWLQLRLETDARHAAAVEDALLEHGALAVTLEDNADQPLFAGDRPTQALWQQTRISGLFPADTDINATLEALRRHAALNGASAESMRADILEDKDWEREWMQHYAPQQIRPGFWLCPSWLTPPESDAINLLLDPGLAFGTGTHPTTAMCLEALAGLDLSGQRVVDFGCGSGILAVAALLLGADSVLATDTDSQALSATWANSERNGVAAGRLSVLHPDGLKGTETADTVVANILAGPLCELAPQLCSMLSTPDATLILSGILEEQAAQVRRSYPLELEIADRRDGWVVMQGQRGASRD